MSAERRIGLSFYGMTAFMLVVIGGATGTFLGIAAYGGIRNDYDVQMQTRNLCIQKHDDRACRLYEVDYGK